MAGEPCHRFTEYRLAAEENTSYECMVYIEMHGIIVLVVASAFCYLKVFTSRDCYSAQHTVMLTILCSALYHVPLKAHMYSQWLGDSSVAGHSTSPP